MLLVSHPKMKARFIKRSTPCCEAALILTSENNWPNSVSSLGPKTLKFSGKHCVTYCAWQKGEALKASKSPKVHVTMLFIFPMLSLKQCDMKVRGGLIFFPRWDWGIKKKTEGRSVSWNWFWTQKWASQLGTVNPVPLRSVETWGWILWCHLLQCLESTFVDTINSDASLHRSAWRVNGTAGTIKHIQQFKWKLVLNWSLVCHFCHMNCFHNMDLK